MNRRLLTILLPLSALAAGCSTFTDNDAIARVNDVELTTELLDDLLVVIPGSAGDPVSDRTNANDVRQAISVWVLTETQRQTVEQRSLTVPEADRDAITGELSANLPAFFDASDAARDLVVDFFVTGTVLSQDIRPAGQELVDFYDQGPEKSGLICVSHILVETEDDADAVRADLDASGADFAAIAGERSIDPGSAVEGGDLGCSSVGEFAQQFIPEFVEGALGADRGVPTDPIESEFGYHVILVRSGAESVDGLQAFASQPGVLASLADVYIDPQYGTYDAAVGAVVPLG